MLSDRIFQSACLAGTRSQRHRQRSAASAWCRCRSGWRRNWRYTWRWRERQINNSELARRLAVHERVIRRMLDPEHASKAEKIQAALAAMGKQMTVEVRDAA